jgi:purine nucleosidase
MFTRSDPDLGPCEWNALVDPHATAMAYDARLDRHRSVGVDMTCQVALDAAEVRDRLPGERWPLLRDMTDTWLRHADGITFHGPLAAASIFDDRLCRFERGTVRVELARSGRRGCTYWTPGGPDPKHEVAVDVDAKAFFQHYFSLVR